MRYRDGLPRDGLPADGVEDVLGIWLLLSVKEGTEVEAGVKGRMSEGGSGGRGEPKRTNGAGGDESSSSDSQ